MSQKLNTWYKTQYSKTILSFCEFAMEMIQSAT